MVGYSAKSCMFLLFLPLFPGFAMDSGSCDRNLSDPSGQIYTPGFDEFRSYPSSTTCTWLITVDQSSTIVFQFHTMDIEFDFHCEYDYVLVSRIKEIISSKLNSLHRSSFFSRDFFLRPQAFLMEGSTLHERNQGRNLLPCREGIYLSREVKHF